MSLFDTILVAIVFLIAGLVKGAIGLGLPPIAVALLVIWMPPPNAIALLVLPSLATNGLQAVVGGHFVKLLRRFWPTFSFLVVSTVALAGFTINADPSLAMGILGGILLAYAGIALSGVRVSLSDRNARRAGPVAGIATGMATATTGISSVPIVLLFQSVSLSKDELIQVMGISFSLSAIALWVNVSMAGMSSLSVSAPAILAAVSAVAGQSAGVRIRSYIDEAVFRTIFLVGLLALGLFFLVRASVPVY